MLTGRFRPLSTDLYGFEFQKLIILESNPNPDRNLVGGISLGSKKQKCGVWLGRSRVNSKQACRPISPIISCRFNWFWILKPSQNLCHKIKLKFQKTPVRLTSCFFRNNLWQIYSRSDPKLRFCNQINKFQCLRMQQLFVYFLFKKEKKYFQLKKKKCIVFFPFNCLSKKCIKCEYSAYSNSIVFTNLENWI